MFGYIKPYKPEMKVKEFDTFKAIYCGLCKQLSHVYGPFSSLTLSYDFTFLAAISIGLKEECPCFKKCRCVANPLKRRIIVQSCSDLQFCASTAMTMIYYKIKDDIMDAGFFRKIAGYCILPFAYYTHKKAKKNYPDIDTILCFAMKQQANVEDNSQTSIDRAADPTGCALASICELLSNNDTQKKILNRFGYLLGRYVYFADALDDLEDDLKSGNYNPFLIKKENISLNKIKEYAEEVLNLTIGEIAPAYELLMLKRYKSILDNIIYLGLHNEITNILKKNESKKEKGAVV